MSAPLGALGLDVWLADWRSSVINRKLNTSHNKTRVSKVNWLFEPNDSSCFIYFWHGGFKCCETFLLAAPFSIKRDAEECASLIRPHCRGSGFIITPQVQVFTYLMETASHFRALNKKWQQHPRTTEETKATNNKQPCGWWPALSRSGGDVLPVQSECLTHIPL